MFENVASMPAADKAIITKELGVEPIMINSALVSAQQRKRLYWTNIPGVTQPEDKGLLLKDILESGQSFESKAHVLTANYFKAIVRNTLAKKQRTMVAEPAVKKVGSFYGQNTRWGIFDKNGKSPTITASCGLGGGRTPMVPEPVLYNKFNQQISTNKSPVIGAGCGVASSKTEQLVVTSKKLGYLAHGGDRQGYKVYSVVGKSICLKSCTSNGSPNELYKIDLPDGDYYIRKLTPVECERLQTLPDNYTEGISNTQRYKCLGNGWTVDVIAHILRGLRNE